MTDEQDEDRRGARWKINKQISIADIVSIVLAAGAGFLAWTNLNTRMSVLEERSSQQVRIDQRQDDEAQNSVHRLEAELNKINDKLDRLIERPK